MRIDTFFYSMNKFQYTQDENIDTLKLKMITFLYNVVFLFTDYCH